MIIKITPDLQKAVALRKMAQVTIERVSETDENKYASNILNDYYDIIHKLLEAISIINGIKVKGDGAHQELIDLIFKKYSISEEMRIFLQQMRDYRNRIAYDGFIVNKNYLSLNNKIINRIIQKLLHILDKIINKKK